MGQDISLKLTVSSETEFLEISQESRAHSSLINTGREAITVIGDVYETLNLSWGNGNTSRDYEENLYFWGTDQRLSQNDWEDTPEWFKKENPFKGETKEITLEKYERTLNVRYSSLEVLQTFLGRLWEKGVFWFQNGQLHIWDGKNILKPAHEDLSVEERKMYKIQLPIKRIELPEEVVKILKTSFEVTKWINHKADAFRNYGKGADTNLSRAVADGKISAWEENGDRFLYLEGEYLQKISFAINAEVIDLTDWYLAEENKPYNQAYHAWLESNGLKRLHAIKGAGVSSLMFFRFT